LANQKSLNSLQLSKTEPAGIFAFAYQNRLFEGFFLPTFLILIKES